MTAVLPARTTTPAGLPLFESADADFARHYAEQGFALLADGLSPSEVAAINTDAVRLCRGEFGEIRYGYRDAEQAGDNPGTRPSVSDEELLREYLCIHYPHKVSAAARAALHAPRIVEGLVRVIGPNVKAMQSMLFIKSRGQAGSGVAPGRVLHPDPRPVADGGLDRPGRCNRGERLPVGAPGVAAAGRDLPGPGAGRIPASTAPPSPTTSPTPTTRPCPSRSRPARRWSSTATCCTGRWRTRVAMATGELSPTTT